MSVLMEHFECLRPPFDRVAFYLGVIPSEGAVAAQTGTTGKGVMIIQGTTWMVQTVCS